MLLLFLNGRSVVRMSKKEKEKKKCWNTEANPCYPGFLRYLWWGFGGWGGVVWQLAITNGFLPALITQPTNSKYDSVNRGRRSNLTAGWREGKEATFSFLVKRWEWCMPFFLQTNHHNCPQEAVRPSTRHTATESLAEPSNARILSPKCLTLLS